MPLQPLIIFLRLDTIQGNLVGGFVSNRLSLTFAGEVYALLKLNHLLLPIFHGIQAQLTIGGRPLDV